MGHGSLNASQLNAAAGGSSDDDVVRFGRLSSCLLKQRPGNFHWIHVHETWLEGVGPNEVLNLYDDNNSESSGSYEVEATYKTGALNDGRKNRRVSRPPGVDMSLGYGDHTAQNGDTEDGHHVRFNSQREEVSYKYKKVHHDHGNEGKPATVPEEAASPNRGASKTLAKKAKDKPVVQLTPVPANAQAPSNASRRRHISPQLTDYAKACMVNNELIGISLHGWDIGTGQGPMGDEGWFSAATTNFENVSQYRGSNSNKLRRRVALPEMVFPAAHVAFEHRKENLWISWDVLDAMDDWAKAHQRIPVNSDKEHNGVSVLKSEDAALWAKKKKNLIPDSGKSKDAFHFDWTYSSPFSGSVEGGYWEQLSKTGLKLEMLKDKSIPILFFDELVLYEDDLHDTGHAQYSLKIRVMPTCGFVLARLWVRIDRVLLRLRETRVLFEFGKTPDETTKIYRDITWKECAWQNLSNHSLPNDVKAWRSEGPETPQLAMLMSKLPEIDLPQGIFKHAILKRGGKSKAKS